MAENERSKTHTQKEKFTHSYLTLIHFIHTIQYDHDDAERGDAEAIDGCVRRAGDL